MITREELIQIFEAADLDPNREEIQEFLKENEDIFDDLHDLKDVVIDLLCQLDRDIWIGKGASAQQISQVFNEFLAKYSAELWFTENEIQEFEEATTWYGVRDVLSIIQRRLSQYNLEVMEFNTYEDAVGFIVFLKDKLREIKHLKLIQLMDFN